jgi:hypothetical protein
MTNDMTKDETSPSTSGSGALSMNEDDSRQKNEGEPEVLAPGNEAGIENGEEKKPKRGLRFWCIMIALVSSGLLSTLEGTIISTALPTIIRDLGGGDLYTWAINAYFLTR